MTDELVQFVIYESPNDYPGKFVVREYRISPGTIRAATEPAAVVDTLEEARAVIPEGMVLLQPQEGEHKSIREVWT